MKPLKPSATPISQQRFFSINGRNLIFPIGLGLLLAIPLIAQDDWSRWRGPLGNGIAAEDQKPPVQWDEQTNVVWKAKIPGRGHSSPIVIGDRILLATGDVKQQTQAVLCYHRKTGELLWETVVNRGQLNPRLHPNNTHASSTVATDGERAFAVFNNRDSVFITALSLTGEILWEQKVGGYDPYYKFGFGSSPVVYRNLVIVANHNDGDPAMVAYRVDTGEPVWKIKAAVGTNYSTPAIIDYQGTDQLIISGLGRIAAYQPEDGQLIWETPAKWQVSCGTVVWDDQRIYASGGFPPPQTLAVSRDGRGTLVWENNQKSYEQSMLLHQGFLYTHTDSGLVFCWRGEDGNVMWRTRFSSKGQIPQSASPVLADGNIYVTAENGETLVFRATPESFQEVARNQLGDQAFASMAICGHQIFMRVASYESDSKRDLQEWLYCLGERK
jgi:outer membrane protein assembly factor BamB